MLSNVLILTIMHTKSSILAANVFVLVEKHKFTRFLICSNQPSSKKKKELQKANTTQHTKPPQIIVLNASLSLTDIDTVVVISQ